MVDIARTDREFHKKLRDKFFSECTDDISGLKKVNMAPHDLFKWFMPYLKKQANRCPNCKALTMNSDLCPRCLLKASEALFNNDLKNFKP